LFDTVYNKIVSACVPKTTFNDSGRLTLLTDLFLNLEDFELQLKEIFNFSSGRG
jgi:hypothetical protein